MWRLWRVAVFRTYEKYRRERVVELLPEAYKLYLEHTDGKVWDYPGRKEYGWDIDIEKSGLQKKFREDIIEGRMLNGESADLNF